MVRTMLLVMMLSLLLACGDDNGDGNPQAQGETVFFNGEIYTVNPNAPWATAVYVKDGVIQYVGTDEEAKGKASAAASMIDLEGAFMMPGIHDVHMHPLEASSDNFNFTVDERETDPENYALDVEDAIKKNPGSDWLLGWGHYLETVLEATRAPKAILDDVAPDRPVVIMEQTSHSVWCNSKALELIGFTSDSEDPQGGVIMREANGEPNGILIDNAGNLLIDLAVAANTNNEDNDYNGLVEFGLPELAKHGITSLCDARTYWKRNHHKTWQRLADEDKLTVRVNLGLWAYPTEDDDTQITKLKELYQYDANSLLKINQIKIYSDGIVHNTTAAIQGDYLVDYFEGSTNNGLNYFTEARIGKYIAALEGTGFDFHIHTIGNRGINESLNAIEQNTSGNGRHRLTHVEVVDASDYTRFSKLNVTADAQVAGDFTNPDAWSDNDHLIGAALTGSFIPIKSLNDAQARVTLSSDWDVSTINPFTGLQNAVTREPQALSLEDAVKAYTVNAAYVMRQEDKVGSIEVGKEADLIVLDRNIFEISPNKIGKTVVLETYLQGERVYER